MLVCAAAFVCLMYVAAHATVRRPPSVQPASRSSEMPQGVPARPRGVQIVQSGSYPELHVDGKPFFIYSAEFLYPRIPRSLWEPSLDRYREIGINTITISIPWNWHEPEEGKFDFDGHTNPRRDLRTLLRMISERGFKLIARPGPTVLHQWRCGGYPDWLLERPEYHMSLADRLEGRVPPAVELEAVDAESAARQWQEIPGHMSQVEAWLQAVAHELSPYQPSMTVPVAAHDSASEKTHTAPVEIPGPLLFVLLSEGLGSGRGNAMGREFWKYAETLCGNLAHGGVDVPCFINSAQPREPAAETLLTPPVATLGQWFAEPSNHRTDTRPPIGPSEISSLALAAATLGTQPGFPSVLAEFSTSEFAPQDDARPAPGSPEDTGMAGHLLLGFGIRGWNWFPLQDTLTPAGYGTAAANRLYSWDAPLSLTRERQPGVRGVERMGEWLRVWGSWLATAHPRADLGLVDTLSSLPRANMSPTDIEAVIWTEEQVQRLAQYSGLTSEIVDPEHQPAEQLLRHALLLMPVHKPAEPAYALSPAAQRTLAAYVRGGGMLVCFPGPPVGAEFAALEREPESRPSLLPEGTKSWRAGEGRLVVLTKDFYSWVSLDEDFADARQNFSAPFARSLLRAILAEADVRPSIRRADSAATSTDLLATELVSDEGTLPLGNRSGGQALLSVINLSFDSTISETVDVLSPSASSRGSHPGADDWISIPVTLPPRESLLLPVDWSLCTAPDASPGCKDRIVFSGAELLGARRDGKTMYLTLYAPVKATMRVFLAGEPEHIEIDESRAAAQWVKRDHEVIIDLLRGAAPQFLRVLRIPLPYRAGVPERPKQDSRHPAPAHFRFSPAGAARLPLGTDTALLTNPPLFVLDRGSEGSLGVVAENLGGHDDTVEVEAIGPFSTSARAYVGAGELRSLKLKLPAATVEKVASGPPGPDGLYHGTLHFSGGPESVDMATSYAILPAEGTVGYRFDFDADGNEERVLENQAVRAIFSPAAGGRLIAFFLKSREQNLASTMGLLEDAFSFTPGPSVRPGDDTRGTAGTFNRKYAAEWLSGNSGPSLRLAYDAPDVYPHGAHIEKTTQLSGSRQLTVDYHVSLLAADAARLSQEAAGKIFAATPPAEPVPQSFEILNSIPADSAEASRTQLCWTIPPAETTDAGAQERCVTFVPSGPITTPPAGVRRVEIRRPRHAGLVVAWDDARARITLEPKNYSVLLRLAFPPLPRGGAAAAYRIEFSVLEAQ